MPSTCPLTSDLNFTPSSTAFGSAASAVAGVTPDPHIEQGHETFTETPAEGLSLLPLSSTARDLIVVLGLPCATQLYDQLEVPLAGCQVAPPSVETSTPATTPPPASVAVPEMVTLAPSVRLAPALGELIVELGAAVSVEAVAGTSPDCSVCGWAPMSANRLTVACFMLGSGGLPL